MSQPAQTSAVPISVEEHQSRVAALIGTLPVVALPVGECLGLALAEDLVAPIALPPFDNSAMDGYAVRAADLAGAGHTTPVVLPVTEDIPAGRTDVVALAPGTAHRIMTGAPMPPGADAVIQVELTDAGRDQVAVYAEVPPGQHVRRTGDDVRPGTTLLTAGTMLGPVHLGLAAAVGSATLRVRRRPRVLVLSTGSELVEPGRPLLPGQIYESNGTLLAAAVTTCGGLAELLRFVPDNVPAFHAALSDVIDTADLVITSGGVSAGAYEVVKDALAGAGVHFYRVAMQPGGPQGAGTYRGVPIVALPGNPVSAAVSFEIFIRPALRAALGLPIMQDPRPHGTLTAEVSGPPGRRQFRRGRYDSATERVAPVGGPGSHLLASLASANCLFVVPETAGTLPVGAQVEIVGLAALNGDIFRP